MTFCRLFQFLALLLMLSLIGYIQNGKDKQKKYSRENTGNLSEGLNFNSSLTYFLPFYTRAGDGGEGGTNIGFQLFIWKIIHEYTLRFTYNRKPTFANPEMQGRLSVSVKWSEYLSCLLHSFIEKTHGLKRCQSSLIKCVP